MALLDNAMARLYERCRDKNFKTHEESRLFERLFTAYTALGGNGAVADEHKQFRLIELKDE